MSHAAQVKIGGLIGGSAHTTGSGGAVDDTMKVNRGFHPPCWSASEVCQWTRVPTSMQIPSRIKAYSKHVFQADALWHENLDNMAGLSMVHDAKRCCHKIGAGIFYWSPASTSGTCRSGTMTMII
jgi:hypothetical protein